MIHGIFTEGIYIKCDNDHEFKQANDYLNFIGINYYKPSNPHPDEHQKEHNSYIYLHGEGDDYDEILYIIHYSHDHDINDDSIHNWSYIKQRVGYIDVNIDEIISNLNKLEDKYK